MEGVTRYLRKMRRVLRHTGKRPEDIEDLMQDAFVRLLEYCKAGADVREPEAVLVTTVRRLALNHTRDQHLDRLESRRVEELLLIDPAPPPEEVFKASQCLRDIRKSIQSLGNRTCQVFFLQRLYGYSYEQISEVTGMPVSTIEKHIARAMTILMKERRRLEGREDAA